MSLVYILNKNSNPLMPCKPSKARRLLKQNKAKVVKRCPFTIQLLFGSTGFKQDINLGIDAGSKHIGISATTDKKVLYEADIVLRNDIVDLLSTRRQNRRTRRNKLRHRQARFNNRVTSKHKGWLAPSVEQKIQTHFKVVENVHKILPITKIIVETASFDIQKIKNPEINGEQYQQGEQLDFWNTREYVLSRDNHTCQCCKGKSKDKILNVHHLESRKTGGNAPNNLITLCETCHKKYHKGEVELPKTIKRGAKFNDATFMGIMRWSFFTRLKEQYKNVHMTYGYITKNTRIKHDLPKEHYVDARCISGNPDAESLHGYFLQKKVRCHNRQLYKSTINKGGTKNKNQAPFEVFGYRLFDKVLCNEQIGFVFGRRLKGSFDIRKLDNQVITSSITHKKLKLLDRRKGILTDFVKIN